MKDMNIQFSQGSHSPNVNGDNNNVIAGDNNEQKNKTVQKKKKVAEYTIGGIIIALLISFLGSYLVYTCTDSNSKSQTTVRTEALDSIQVAP